MRTQSSQVSMSATSGLDCMTAVTAARVACIFHRIARIRTGISDDAAATESAVRAISSARS